MGHVLIAREAPVTAKVSGYDVDCVETMESVIRTAIREGYVVANKTATSATLILRKQEFSVLLWLVMTLFLIVPGILYLIWDSLQRDLVVEISIDRALLEGPDEESFVHLEALHTEGFLNDLEFASVRQRIEHAR
jgi:hypothetical protein